MASPARELRRRRRARLRKTWQQRWRHRFHRLVRAVLAAAAILVVGTVLAMVTGGASLRGVLATLLVMMVAFVLFAVFPRTRILATGSGDPAGLAGLTGQTQAWLESRRGLLPAKGRTAVDLLASRLDELAPRLDRLDDADPAAQELRKLLSEHLPMLVNSYTNLPAALTVQPHAGSTPAAQLVAGLDAISRAVEAIGETMAGAELDALAIRGRYLDARYEGPSTGSG